MFFYDPINTSNRNLLSQRNLNKRYLENIKKKRVFCCFNSITPLIKSSLHILK